MTSPRSDDKGDVRTEMDCCEYCACPWQHGEDKKALDAAKADIFSLGKVNQEWMKVCLEKDALISKYEKALKEIAKYPPTDQVLWKLAKEALSPEPSPGEDKK